MIPSSLFFFCSVIERLQRSDVQRRRSSKNTPSSLPALAPLPSPQTTAPAKDALQEFLPPSILPSPKVLLEKEVQRSYRNVASASILSVKQNQKERKVKAKAEQRRKQRARRLRLADDRNYVKQRAERHAEGLVKLTGLRE